MRFPLFLLFLTAVPACCQVNYGEVRFQVSDPSGVAAHVAVELTCAGNGYGKTFITDETGKVAVHAVPYGVYQAQVWLPGFAPLSKTIEVRSALHVAVTLSLHLPSVETEVSVSGTDTLIDPNSPSSVMQIGSKQIEQRVASLPGRSVQDLVDSQPGWLYEGNAVLHPRGSEYQTQFVIDGIPLTDNRSPSFGPEIEADDLDSISVYTAGYLAEYGRKMGGAVELNTRRQSNPGVHGEFVLLGGSYNAASGYGQLQNVWGKNTAGAAVSGGMSSHYLNPVVPENYTNTGTTGDFSAHYERDLTPSDHLTFSVRHELSRFLIPNELIQQQAGQVQNGDNFETMGTAIYQHIVSPNSLFVLSGLVRDNSNDLESNHTLTPSQHFSRTIFAKVISRGPTRCTTAVRSSRQASSPMLSSCTRASTTPSLTRPNSIPIRRESEL